MKFRVPSAAEVEAREQQAERQAHQDKAKRVANPPGNAATTDAAIRESSIPAQPSTVPPMPSIVLPTAPSIVPPMAPPTTISSSHLVPTWTSRNALLVNGQTQRGNPILDFVQNVPYEYAPPDSFAADFLLGRTTCAFYLSIRYHRLHPDYIYARVKRLGAHPYTLRVLLVQVDVDDPQSTLRELSRVAITGRLTLVLAWSLEEAGRYLETFKAYENKPADLIKEKVDDSHFARVTDFLTAVKGVNKTDVVTLLNHFGTLRNVVHATPEELLLLPGFGEQKVRRLLAAFHEPFLAQPRLLE